MGVGVRNSSVTVAGSVGPGESKTEPRTSKWGAGSRRFLADLTPLLGSANHDPGSAQRRMDVGRAPIAVAPQHGNDAPNRTSNGCAMMGLCVGRNGIPLENLHKSSCYGG